MKDLILLGATGSIGTQTFKAIENSDYRIQVITVGKNVVNPITLLESEKLKALVSELREKYDNNLVLISDDDVGEIAHKIGEYLGS